jgi:hypothetical protein
MSHSVFRPMPPSQASSTQSPPATNKVSGMDNNETSALRVPRPPLIPEDVTEKRLRHCPLARKTITGLHKTESTYSLMHVDGVFAGDDIGNGAALLARGLLSGCVGHFCTGRLVSIDICSVRLRISGFPETCAQTYRTTVEGGVAVGKEEFGSY